MEIKTLLAFGDSLTNGFGVAKEHSYPKHLENLLGINVINAGIDGEFSDEGLYRLRTVMNPDIDLVILCHGANDIINNLPKSDIKANLLSMIQIIKENRIDILLVGVPDYYDKTLSTDTIYEEIAKESKVLFEDEVLSKIARDNSLRSDFVHPNERGYALMAELFFNKLKNKNSNLL